MLEFVVKLSENVQSDWEKQGFRENAFPAVASKSLEGLANFETSDLVRLILHDLELPAQRRLDVGFGEPNITLFSSNLFEIEAIFWTRNTPAIHEHSFCGAFCMLAGVSMHSSYSYQQLDCIEGIGIGSVDLKAQQKFEPRRIQKIERGSSFIHSNFHLIDPGITLVIRTIHRGAAERTFLPPHLAIDGISRDEAFQKKLQLLDMLNSVGSQSYMVHTEELIECCSLKQIVRLMLRVAWHDISREAYEAILRKAFSRVRAQNKQKLAVSMEAARRRAQLLRLRSNIRSYSVRTTMACLMECSGLTDFKQLMMLATSRQLRDAELLESLLELLPLRPEQHDLAFASVSAILDGADFDEFVLNSQINELIKDNHATLERLEAFFNGLRDLPWLQHLACNP